MIDERMWKIVQKRMGYSDDEIEIFKNNPRNEEVLSKSTILSNKKIKVNIVEAHGCNSRHKKGDTFYLDGYGNLIKESLPDKLCIYALSAISTLMYSIHELIYAGIDPNLMKFKRVGCIDVGLNCGGWGKIIMEISVEDKYSQNYAP